MAKCSYCGAPMGNEGICSICGQKVITPAEAKSAPEVGGGSPTEEVDKQMSSDKTQKGMKSFGKLLGGLQKISPQAIILEKLMMLLEPFLNLIDLINPLIEILAGLFEQMLVPVIKAILPLILLLAGFLNELKPIFLAIGDVLGGYVTKIVSALIPIFEAMADVVRPFIPLFNELTPLFDMMFEMLFPFLPLLELLIPLIEMLVPVIWFVVHGIRAMIPYLKMASGAIKSFVGWIKTAADFLNSLNWNNWGSGGGGGGGGGGDDWWPFQTGGLVMRPTKGIVGEAGPEAVIPLPQLKNIIEGDNTAEIEVLRNSEITIDLLEQLVVNTKTRRR